MQQNLSEGNKMIDVKAISYYKKAKLKKDFKFAAKLSNSSTKLLCYFVCFLIHLKTKFIFICPFKSARKKKVLFYLNIFK